MGKSRSATVCIAYLLQRQPNALTPQSALALLRECRPFCEPNDGFMEQLCLYHEMGCPDDVANHPHYIRWQYRREVEESVACGRVPEMKSILFEDEQPYTAQESTNQKMEIKCRKCRRTLATAPFLIPHEPGSHIKPNISKATECAHVFLHPLTWMRPSLFPSTVLKEGDAGVQADAPLSGRLTCPTPTCGASIGKFAWQGMQCSCGHWVVPAIGVAKARIDIVDKMIASPGSTNFSPGGPPLGIRLPPGMRTNNVSEAGSGRGNL